MPKVRTATHAGTWYSSSGALIGWVIKGIKATPCLCEIAMVTAAAIAPPPSPADAPLYPAAGQLQQQLQQWLDEAAAEPGQHARAIIAPHAGYRCGAARCRWQ